MAARQLSTKEKIKRLDAQIDAYKEKMNAYVANTKAKIKTLEEEKSALESELKNERLNTLDETVMKLGYSLDEVIAILSEKATQTKENVFEEETASEKE